MKLWVVLVAVTLLAGCGVALPTPSPTAPPSRIWGYLGVLEEAAANATARLRGAPFIQKLQLLVTTVQERASALGAGLRAEVTEVWERAGEYGAEARAALDSTLGELKNRGATYGRKLRKRLNRDGDDLRRRWDALGQAWGGQTAAALRRSWGAGGEGEGEPQDL